MFAVMLTLLQMTNPVWKHGSQNWGSITSCMANLRSDGPREESQLEQTSNTASRQALLLLTLLKQTVKQ